MISLFDDVIRRLKMILDLIIVLLCLFDVCYLKSYQANAILQKRFVEDTARPKRYQQSIAY